MCRKHEAASRFSSLKQTMFFSNTLNKEVKFTEKVYICVNFLNMTLTSELLSKCYSSYKTQSSDF